MRKVLRPINENKSMRSLNEFQLLSARCKSLDFQITDESPDEVEYTGQLDTFPIYMYIAPDRITISSEDLSDVFYSSRLNNIDLGDYKTLDAIVDAVDETFYKFFTKNLDLYFADIPQLVFDIEFGHTDVQKFKKMPIDFIFKKFSSELDKRLKSLGVKIR